MIDPGLPIARRANGTPILFAALGAQLHLEPPVAKDCERFEHVNALVLDWFGSELKWTLNSAFGESEPFRIEDLEYLAGHPSSLVVPDDAFDDPTTQEVANAFRGAERARFAIACHGGETEAEASPYGYRYYCDAPFWDDARKSLAPSSMLRLTVPATWPVDDFLARVRAIVALLRVRWGSAGLMYGGYEIAHYNETREAIYAHARRYTGFDVGQYATLIKIWHDHIRTVSWLSYLGPTFVERLAAKGVKIDSGGLLVVSKVGDALEIRAGEQPEPGDQNRLRLPRAYVQADDLVRPLRAGSKIDFMDPWSQADTEKWLRRFEKRVY